MVHPQDPNLQCWQTWCFGVSRAMKEKLFLAIVITIVLSWLHNWSTPTPNSLRTSAETEPHHLASFPDENLSGSVFLLQDSDR
ncbi:MULTISPECIES: hypothetical protein [unclassified Leptolyngbya]|uniref:hypothetical protein n=1 Tax=unclassified Leptolyngbya TaxID=2650499 RepID=UPI003D319D21